MEHECEECGLAIGEGEYEENNGVCDMCFEEYEGFEESSND